MNAIELEQLKKDMSALQIMRDEHKELMAEHKSECSDDSWPEHDRTFTHRGIKF